MLPQEQRSISGVQAPCGGISSRQSKEESRPVALFRFKPDPPAIAFHQLLAYRQSDACSWILLRSIQALKKPEDLLMKAGSDAEAVVANGEQPSTVLRIGARADLDHRWRLAAILQSV